MTKLYESGPYLYSDGYCAPGTYSAACAAFEKSSDDDRCLRAEGELPIRLGRPGSVRVIPHD